MMQGVGMVYVFLLLGLVCPSLFTENQIKEKEQEVSYPNASAYMAATVEEKPKIAITFDDGPNAECTPKLLDGLQKRGVKATFFLIGQNIEKGNNREIVKRMYEEGHLIGNHTYHHVEITRVSNEKAYEELMMCNELIQSITGQEVEYMRPPFGLWQKELEQKIHVLPVMWNVDPLDWATENVDEIVNKVVTRTEENDIILLHDCYDSSVKAALRIIDLLQAEGFEFVTVDQIILD
ncbi:polysaccharide deacetylase family protein [Faecalicatena contorta]|nr:polysaccharide deacetylase family protein [Faecalicatena contorta]